MWAGRLIPLPKLHEAATIIRGAARRRQFTLQAIRTTKEKSPAEGPPGILEFTP